MYTQAIHTVLANMVALLYIFELDRIIGTGPRRWFVIVKSIYASKHF